MCDEQTRSHIQIYTNDKLSLFDTKWWLGASDLEIVSFQLYVQGLEMICERQVFLTALERVLGRSVSEQELNDQDLLIDEFEMKCPQ